MYYFLLKRACAIYYIKKILKMFFLYEFFDALILMDKEVKLLHKLMLIIQ